MGHAEEHRRQQKAKRRAIVGWLIALAVFLGIIWRFTIWWFLAVAVIGGFSLL